LQLDKPLVFFDIESTGLSITKDRIVEISFLKALPDGSTERKRYLLNPQIPISPEAQAIHGISNETVGGCPVFEDVSREILDFLEGSDLAGFNSLKFDIPMLMEEFFRVGIDLQVERRNLVDVQVIFHKMEERTLSAAYKFYCNKTLENAHSATADVEATWEVFLEQVKRYSVLPDSIAALAQWMGNDKRVDMENRLVRNEQGIAVFNFGKHKGKPVSEVFAREPSYYNWMMDGDFSSHIKRIITKIKMGVMN
jgi:DNA polymerase III subunit epsilon